MHADPVRSPDLYLEAVQLPGSGGGHCERGDGMREPSRRTNGAALRIAGFVLALAVLPAEAAQIDIHGPPGSVAFGAYVAVLPNGNIVVTDPNRPFGPASNAGAVYLYSPAGDPISTLTGTTAGDYVGSGGIVVVRDGNFVIRSYNWHNGAAAGAGAVTWANGSTGISGVVSAANSLIGNSANDFIGGVGVIVLSNGNYVVVSPYWDNGATADAGAVTWGHGSTGIAGVVSPQNSWVGTATGDYLGNGGVIALSNGNYVFASPYWYNAEMAMVYAGAVTWSNGGMAIAATVSPLNSLVGTNTNDSVGYGGITALGNGNYVVASPNWHNGGPAYAGAATWGDGSLGTVGAVSAANSLVGTTVGDLVGTDVVALSNGNYVVASPYWNNGGSADVGAATWGDGSAGIAGAVSAANSLVGTTPGDHVGLTGVFALSNGNYVVTSPDWSNSEVAAARAGAATWAYGGMAIGGAVSPINSLVGTSANDLVGRGGVIALSNGNYVVASPYWHYGGVADAGAATWGNGSLGTVGVVSPVHSLVGTSAGDLVGSNVVALTNGNYVVNSSFWHNGGWANAGAATWGHGSVGIAGAISALNSLVGTSTDENVGYDGVVALSNGNYVVGSQSWDNGGLVNVGAATWGNGSSGTTGPISPLNSLFGTTAGDCVGNNGVVALGNGDYVVASRTWNNGGIVEAGAISLGRGGGGTIGPIAGTNSVRGTVAGGGSGMTFAFDAKRDTLVVGQPAANLVSLFKADLLFKNGFQ